MQQITGIIQAVHHYTCTVSHFATSENILRRLNFSGTLELYSV